MIQPKKIAKKLSVVEEPIDDRSSFIVGQPLYQELKRKIIDNLNQGVWKPGQIIPSESALSKRYNISIGTIRKAVDALVLDNILIRHQGRGTFVVTNNTDRYFYSFFRIVHESGQREYPKVELLKFTQIKADIDSAQALNIGVSDSVYKIVNRLSLKGYPAVIDEILVASVNFPHLTEKMLKERTSTIYSFYQQCFGISILRISEKLRAISAQEPYTSLLRVANGSPLLMVKRVAYTFRERPIEYRRSYIDTKRYEYDAEPIFG